MKGSSMSKYELLKSGEGGRVRKTKGHPDLPDGESDSITRNLPNEIMLDIFSRLPFDSVLDCKLVCKSWCKTIQNPCFAHIHLQRALLGQQHNDHRVAVDNKMSFLFLALKDESKLYHGYFHEYRKSPDEVSYSNLRLTEEGRRQIQSGEYFERRKHKMEFKIINHPYIKKHSSTSHAMVGSCNGLVCFSVPYTNHVEDPIYICNPAIREQIVLPRFTIMVKNKNNLEVKKTTFLDGHIVSGFGYNSITDEYKVVRIYYADSEPRSSCQPKGIVQVYTLGSGSGWRNIGEISYSLQLRSSGGILANGALHWWCKEWKIVAFNLAQEEFSLLPSPPFHPDGYNLRLQVLAGRLCVAYGSDNPSRRLDIWSFKKDSSEWQNMFSLSCCPSEYLDLYWPMSLTWSGKLLLRSKYWTLTCYDPRTGEFENLIKPTHHDNCQLIEAIPHMNSFVSLKALGEKSKMIKRYMV